MPPILKITPFVPLLAAMFACKPEPAPVPGCTWPNDPNYNPDATYYDGSCISDTIEPLPANFDGEMQTVFAEDWDNWTFEMNGVTGSVVTNFSEDWDNWHFNFAGVSGNITTAFYEDWDNWDLVTSDYSISIETAFSEDWDNWELNDNNGPWQADVETVFADDWDNWEAEGDSISIDLATVFADDLDNWETDGYVGAAVPVEFKMAILFVPVIVNVLRQQGLIP